MQCSVCEKSLVGHRSTEEQTVCGSCALTPLMERVAEEAPGTVSFRKKGRVTKKVARSPQQVHFGIRAASMKVPEPLSEVKMTLLKVKSNSARNRTILLSDGTVVTFDATGVATVPAGGKAAMEIEMHVRPGRYSWIVDETPVPVEALSLDELRELVSAQPPIDSTAAFPLNPIPEFEVAPEDVVSDLEVELPVTEVKPSLKKKKAKK